MKEELLKLRELTSTYSESKKQFEEKREAFNASVKDTMVILGSEVKAADYDTVSEFYNEYAELVTYAAELKKEHPRYGEKRVKDTLVDMVSKTYQDRSLYASQIVTSFLSYENNGYSEVRALEVASKANAVNLVESVDTVKNEAIDTTVTTVNKALEQAKPYTDKAKKAINKGAKILIKILKETEDKKD